MGFFTSTDLKTWERQSELESFYECPELFQLPVDGDSPTMRWILYGASGEYFTGDFDGKTYTPDGNALPFNYGNCFYASQTFSNIPPEDGRRIQIAWGRTGHPDMPFNQMMNFPVELTLRTTESGPRLFAWPVREIAVLYQKEKAFPVLELADTSRRLENITGGLYDVSAVFEMGDAEEAGVTACGLPITFNTGASELRCGDKAAPLKPADGAIHLRLLVDRLSVEIFANEGRVYMPMRYVQEETDTNLEVFAKGGTATVTNLTVHELASAWATGQ